MQPSPNDTVVIRLADDDDAPIAAPEPPPALSPWPPAHPKTEPVDPDELNPQRNRHLPTMLFALIGVGIVLTFVVALTIGSQIPPTGDQNVGFLYTSSTHAVFVVLYHEPGEPNAILNGNWYEVDQSTVAHNYPLQGLAVTSKRIRLQYSDAAHVTHVAWLELSDSWSDNDPETHGSGNLVTMPDSSGQVAQWLCNAASFTQWDQAVVTVTGAWSLQQ